MILEVLFSPGKTALLSIYNVKIRGCWQYLMKQDINKLKKDTRNILFTFSPQNSVMKLNLGQNEPNENEGTVVS